MSKTDIHFGAPSQCFKYAVLVTSKSDGVHSSTTAVIRCGASLTEHVQNMEQLHAYDCHQNVTEPRATENCIKCTHVYIGTVNQAWP